MPHLEDDAPEPEPALNLDVRPVLKDSSLAHRRDVSKKENLSDNIWMKASRKPEPEFVPRPLTELDTIVLSNREQIQKECFEKTMAEIDALKEMNQMSMKSHAPVNEEVSNLKPLKRMFEQQLSA